MSCVNNRYTPDELESIFIWDCLCEAVPLSREERKAIRDREDAAKREMQAAEPKRNHNLPAEKCTEADRERKRAYAKKYRETHREIIRQRDAAYRAANRADINERQSAYGKSKRADTRLA